jgi:uncharacterized protein
VHASRGAALTGYGIGVPLHSYTASLIVASNFDSVTHAFAATPYEFDARSCAGAHERPDAGDEGGPAATAHVEAAVGQMAFTNYLMHSFICVAIFYMLGWHGKLQRIDLLYILLAIWTFQLIVSPLWLRVYRFGPLEWVWRCSLLETPAVPAESGARYRPRGGLTNTAVAGE